MKGATVTNNRSRIARHAPTSKQKPFCHGEKWEWNFLSPWNSNKRYYIHPDGMNEQRANALSEKVGDAR